MGPLWKFQGQQSNKERWDITEKSSDFCRGLGEQFGRKNSIFQNENPQIHYQMHENSPNLQGFCWLSQDTLKKLEKYFVKVILSDFQ